MANQETCCLIGVGKVYVREWVDTCSAGAPTTNPNPLKFLGNVSDLQQTTTETTVSQPDFTKPGGGTDCSITRIDQVGISLDLNCYSAENLALALFGDSASKVAGTAFLETITVSASPECSLLPLANVPDETTTAVLVTDVGAATTFTADVDYRVTANGIEILEGSTIPASSDIEVTYDFKNSSVVEMLTAGAKTVELFFDGVNEAASNASVAVRYYKVNLSPAASIGYIKSDFDAYTLTGVVQRDACVSDVGGMSQFGKIQLGA